MGYLFVYAGAGCIVAGILAGIWFLVLSQGTGKRLRKKLEEEYRTGTLCTSVSLTKHKVGRK